jgi:hypothetical protein
MKSKLLYELRNRPLDYGLLIMIKLGVTKDDIIMSHIGLYDANKFYIVYWCTEAFQSWCHVRDGTVDPKCRLEKSTAYALSPTLLSLTAFIFFLSGSARIRHVIQCL